MMDDTWDWFEQIIKGWVIVVTGLAVVIAFSIPRILAGVIAGAVVEGAGILIFVYAGVRWGLAMRAARR